jgi:hypothetical protein
MSLSISTDELCGVVAIAPDVRVRLPVQADRFRFLAFRDPHAPLAPSGRKSSSKCLKKQ